jgi:hypothetical protein
MEYGLHFNQAVGAHQFLTPFSVAYFFNANVTSLSEQLRQHHHR